MKTSKLKQWDTFYNSNGYLCLIHKLEVQRGISSVELTRQYIEDYNRTWYKIEVLLQKSIKRRKLLLII